MSSRKAPASRPRFTKATGDQTPLLAPMIPDRLAYRYDHGLMREYYEKVELISKKHRAGHNDVTHKKYITANLVTLICNLHDKKISEDERNVCEEAVKKCLPVREHNLSIMTHSMFVTMVGMLVARALEQAKAKTKKTGGDDLLLDRYYARNIMTHDSSKTSAMETTAYSGIMAYFMEKEQKCQQHTGIDPNTILTPMAKYGFVHHYAHNAHHPEHNAKGEMANVDVIEAVVDGLACMLERQYDDMDSVEEWINGFFVTRFPHKKNMTLAQCVLNALKEHITAADFQALIEFRRAVHAITGRCVPWSKIIMDAPVPRVEEEPKKRSPRAKCAA